MNYVGKRLEVFRNQGDRDARIVSIAYGLDVGLLNDEIDVLIEYEMPNGTTALNIVKPDGSYKTLPYGKLQTSNKWREHLDESLLINNPQSGKKFKTKWEV